MAGLGALAAQSLEPMGVLNWFVHATLVERIYVLIRIRTWLVELIVCGILVLFFLFYFNRLFATLLSYGIRAYTWHKFRVWIDIQAIQVSLLGGRIFFKGIRYHGENETVLVQHGYLTWRYWLRSSRQTQLARQRDFAPQEDKEKLAQVDRSSTSSDRADDEDAELGSVRKQDDSEARLALSVSGLEWFIYNRTPAYDSILEQSLNFDEQRASKHVSKPPSSTKGTSSVAQHDLHPDQTYKRRSTSVKSIFKEVYVPRTSYESKGSAGKPSTSPEDAETRSSSTTDQTLNSSCMDPSQAFILKFLPIEIDCSKGAICLGNETTKALIVTTFSKARGHVDASNAGRRDVFKQLFDFSVEHPVVQMRPNPDFQRTQLAMAEKVIFDSGSLTPKPRWWRFSLNLKRKTRQVARTLREMLPMFRSSVESLRTAVGAEKDDSAYAEFRDVGDDVHEWHGLSRYLDEDDFDDHQAWLHIDYARFSTILDCPSVHLTFYWDVPGVVQELSLNSLEPPLSEDINGDTPPGYGLDLTVKGGTVNYGPWTDRLRAEIQSAFFPNSYVSPTAASKLEAGQVRQATVMAIRVDIESDVTLRIPTRENSKDWQWRGRATAVKDAAALRKQRERKHFRFRRGTKSALGPDIRPFGWLSVTAGPDSTVRYDMDMAARHSGYHNNLTLELKNTRATSSVNHALLWRCPLQKVCCDLSNPLGWNKSHRWSFSIHSDSMEMFMLRDHMFLLTDLISDFVAGQKPEYMTFVPFHYSIDVRFSDLRLYLNANDFNIIDTPVELEDNTFLTLGMQHLEGRVDIPMQNYAAAKNCVRFKAGGQNASLDLTTPSWNTLYTFLDNGNMATLKSLGLSGAYNYYSTNSPKLTDSLVLDITGLSPRIHLHGFLIRYFMNVKENYFGEHLHFRTLEEYQNTLNPGSSSVIEETRSAVKKDNDLDVILNVRTDRACALLPSNIYSRNEGIRLYVLLIEADMRFTNYYMDLQVNSSPVEVSVETRILKEVGEHVDVTNTQLFVDAVAVYGHRLFGAPPTEPTYVCNWDFDVGNILGECSQDFLRVLVSSIQAFSFTLDDDENSLPPAQVTVLHDVTFLRARLAGIRLWITTETAAFLLALETSSIEFDDWSRGEFSKYLRADMPCLSLAAVELRSAIRHRDNPKERVATYACFETGLHVRMLDRVAGFEHLRRLQQQHIRYHDQRTTRTAWLVDHTIRSHGPPRRADWARDDAAMPIPSMPSPCTSEPYQHNREHNGILRNVSHKRRARKKSSFLSSISSSRSDQSNHGHSTIGINEKVPSRHGSGRRSPKAHAYRTHGNSEAYDQEVGSAPTAVAFSSPWMFPHFTLVHVQPETVDMPQKRGQSNIVPVDTNGGPEPNDTMREDAGTAHTGLMFYFPTGFSGFCTPVVFGAVTDLVQGILPKAPEDFLDSVQVKTMERVSSANKHVTSSGLEDMTFVFPVLQIRLINDSSPVTGQSQQVRDQYDVVVLAGRVTCRSLARVAEQHEALSVTKGMLLHTSISSVAITMSERLLSGEAKAATAQARLSDFGLWISLQSEVSARLQLNDFEFVTNAQEIDSLALLIQRTVSMTEVIARDVDHKDEALEMQHLIYHLTLLDSKVTDPVFLTRPSYVLRTANEHLRSSDSWKIISRLRQILGTLQANKHTKFSSFDCGCEKGMAQHEARVQVSSCFSQWQAWDYASGDDIPIMRSIFGETVNPEAQPLREKAGQAECIVNRITVVLDPGPRQSELSLFGVDFSAKITPLAASGLGTDTSVCRTRDMTLQSYCSETTLKLDWDLVNLVGKVIKLMEDSNVPAPSAQHTPAIAKTASMNHIRVFVVCGTDTASICLDSINLRMLTGTEQFRGSLSFDKSMNEIPAESSLVLAAGTAFAKLKNKGRTLFSWKLLSPNIYGAYRFASKSGSVPSSVKFATACQKLRFDMRQDILTMAGIVRQVLHDEVRSVTHLLSLLPLRNTEEIAPAGTTDKAKPPQIFVGLFLNDYRLNFTLLPSLQYAISGQVSRMSIVPRRKSRLSVNFDLKHHEHWFQPSSREEVAIVSSLKMPPINGALSIKTQDGIVLKAITTVEQINFEAAAIRSCVEALNQPSIIRFIEDTKQAVADVQSDLYQAISSSNKPKASSGAPAKAYKFRYRAHATLAGFGIHFAVPALQDEDDQTDLMFMLGASSMHVCNWSKDSTVAFSRPQFEANIREVGLNLQRRTKYDDLNFGRFSVDLQARGWTDFDDNGVQIHNYRVVSQGVKVDLYAKTVALLIDIYAYLQDRFKSFRADESAGIRPLRRLTMGRLDTTEREALESLTKDSVDDKASSMFTDSVYSLDLRKIQVRWILVDRGLVPADRELEDLVFSIREVDLKTSTEGSARLAIADLQLQIVPQSHDPGDRTANSAFLPEVVFKAAYFSTKRDRRFAFQAAGKALDLRLASDCVIPASAIQKSLAKAAEEIRSANKYWTSQTAEPQKSKAKLLGNKILASLLVDADFAGAVMTVSPRKEAESRSSVFGFLKGGKRSRVGRYGQVMQGSDQNAATLRAPGIALKIEYMDNGKEDPSLSTEVKVAASSNTLYPSVVPLILEISSSIREVMEESHTDPDKDDAQSQTQKYLTDAATANGDPTAILGHCKLNVGLWVQKQEFSLSCQPIARVAATAKFDDIFVTINTVQGSDQDRFFSVMTTFNSLSASVQHVYSRESTASFEVKSIVVSLMNSKHISSRPGISAILNISPMQADINAKQLQDFLLFREIWYPAEMRGKAKPSAAATTADNQAYAMQRYQQIAGEAALPWHAVISIHELKVSVDFGQALGRSVFTISKLWASSKKNSDFEQNLCIGFEQVGVDSSGRISGFVSLQNFHARTSIRWPAQQATRAPLVQGSLGFEHLRLKAAFDYQPFAVADISLFEFMMYNVRQGQYIENDRLVGILDGNKVQVFCTTATAGQAVALYQAFGRLVQENQEAYESSLRDLDKYLRRKSVFPSGNFVNSTAAGVASKDQKQGKTASSLYTDVVVTLKGIDLGVFPNTFFDSQILKVEATDASARFAVATVNGKTHSGLGMALGQVRVALSAVNRSNTKALGEVVVEDVIQRATSSRGGTILKVPKLTSSMQTWQQTQSNVIEYTFKSTFEGKVDVGWNYSRIQFIRGMWQTHERGLAQRLGKPLPPSAVKITAEPQGRDTGDGQEKITAVVNMPQSKFEYVALEPPIIDTPQLRDMGEATPPLEWIGLHRERLPNVTHSVIILSLLEIAKEVEDAYTKILGSS